MVACAVSDNGTLTPVFVEKGVKIDTETYMQLVKNNYLADMAMRYSEGKYVF